MSHNAAVSRFEQGVERVFRTLPIWFFPCCFYLLATWEVVGWARHHEVVRIIIAACWSVIGTLHWLHSSRLRKRLNQLQQVKAPRSRINENCA